MRMLYVFGASYAEEAIRSDENAKTCKTFQKKTCLDKQSKNALQANVYKLA